MALVRMAEAYQKMGDAESQRIFERVVRDYADQNDAVVLARAGLKSTTAAARDGIAIARRVWFGPSVDDMGGPSPDGKYLTFTDWETGDLAIRDVTEGTNRRLTAQQAPYAEGYAFKSRVSVDGKRVAFARQKSNGVELRLIGMDGIRQRVLYSNPEVDYIEPAGWSGDGKYVLAALNTRNRTIRIGLIATDDGSEKVLKTLPWGSLGRLALSPDGRFIAYDFQPNEESPNRNIMLLSSSGHREITVSENTAGEEVIGWNPDGKLLLFKSNRSGTPSLWAIHFADGNIAGSPELLRRDIGQLHSMGLTQKGSLYYLVGTSTSDAYTASWDWRTGQIGEAPKLAGHRLVGVNRDPDWSPDGKYLAYASTPTGRDSTVITILASDTRQERQLSPKGIRIWKGTSWSPDGRHIMVVGFDHKKRRGVYAIDVSNGEATVLVQDQNGQTIFNPEWLPGNKAILFYRRDTDSAGTTSHLVVRDLESGSEREVPSGAEKSSYIYTSLSPNGRLLAFSSNSDKGAFRVVPLTGGASSDLYKIDNTTGITTLRGWSPDSREVIFETARRVGVRNADRELWRIPAEGGERHKLLTLDSQGPFRFHPDGKQISFHIGKSSSEIWVLDNFLPALNASK